MKTFNYLASLAILSTLCLVASSAFAANRTVCYQVQIRDERVGCPVVGTTGVKRACNPVGNYSDFVGAGVQLWDKDTAAGDDDYIGTFRIGGTGTRCATFDWETIRQSHPDNTEANPDLYIKVVYEVGRIAGGGPIIAMKDGSGNTLPAVSWRESGALFNIANCATGTTCTFGSIHVPTNSTTNDMAQRFMMVDSAQRNLELHGNLMDGTTVYGWYPVTLNPAGVSCSTGLAWDRTNFCMPQDRGDDGDVVTHEVGHVVNMQVFEQDALNCQKNGAWNMVSSVGFDSGATCEGFASYVAGAAWYNSNNTAVQPFFFGADLEDEALLPGVTCDDHRDIPLQVAKAFWDLVDWNNEPGTRAGVADDDTEMVASPNVFLWLDYFPDGTANRQDRESDSDGVNMYDYSFRAGGREETLLEHNCLADQDPN